MIKSTELSEVMVLCQSVAITIEKVDFLDRQDLEAMRHQLTRALARVNAVERVLVGVPVPRSGD